MDNGPTYTGRVKVEYRGDNVYYVYWNIPGSSEYRGVGLLDHQTLCVGWSSSPGYGVVIYKVADGRLYGNWLADNTEWDLGMEDLEGPAGLDGVYQIVEAYGADMGDEYSGTVEIRPTGEVYNLTWWIGNEVYTGVGLLKGDLLIVGWGPSAGVVYYDLKDNELLGRWASPGATTAGLENLVRKYRDTSSAAR